MNRINIITLAVTDLDKSIKFYMNGLGFKSRNTDYTRYNPNPVIFFNTDGGVIFGLTTARINGLDTSENMREPKMLSGVILEYVCKDKEEVDIILTMAKKAGATSIVDPVETEWDGYMGYFRDLDGYDWTVLYDPIAKFDDNGNLVDYE